jgi:hypothetical protein
MRVWLTSTPNTRRCAGHWHPDSDWWGPYRIIPGRQRGPSIPSDCPAFRCGPRSRSSWPGGALPLGSKTSRSGIQSRNGVSREHRMPTNAQPSFASSVDARLFACLLLRQGQRFDDSACILDTVHRMRGVHVRLFLSFRNGQCNPQMAVPSKRGSWSEWTPGRGFDIRDGTVDFCNANHGHVQNRVSRLLPLLRLHGVLGILLPRNHQRSTLVNSRSRNHIQSLMMLAMHARTEREGPRPNQRSPDPCCRKPFAASCVRAQTGGAPACQFGKQFASGVGGTLLESDR